MKGNHESEATILNRVMLAISNVGARCFRNHVGLGWQGQIHRFTRVRDVTVRPGDVLVRNATALKAGLCNGSSDLIGWRTVKVTADMVGREVAVFMAVETKSESGRLTEEQGNFLNQVKLAGGIAMESRNAEETALIVANWPLKL